MKHYFILILVICLSNCSYSQTWLNLKDSLIIYFRNGQYDKGIIVGQKAIIAAKREYGEKHTNYAVSLNDLAILYEKLGQYDKAERFYIYTIEIRKDLLGYNHLDYVTSLNNLAGFYNDRRQYEKAEPLYIQVMEIRKKVLGENHPDYAISLSNLAVLYYTMGQYGKAEPLFIQTIEIRKTILGDNHPNYARSLNNLAVLYKDMHQYEKAEPLYIQVMEIRKKVLGENHPDYAKSLNNLAELYKNMGQNKKVELLYIQGVEIGKKAFGETHPDYAKSLSNLAELYYAMHLYDKAEPLFIQTIKIRKKVLGENHFDYSTSLNNLAALYYATEQYDKAEPLFIQSKEIYWTLLGDSNPNYAASLYNLAMLYQNMSQFDKAELLYIQLKEIRKKILGDKHPDYASSLHILGELYYIMGQYDKAEPLYINTIEIRKEILGDNHPDYASSLESLAQLYRTVGKFEKAEPLFIQVKEITKTASGDNHPDYAMSLHHLGSLYLVMGIYEKAEPLFIEAKEINKRALGENHEDYAANLHNLALLYWKKGQYEKAEPLLIEANEIVKKTLGQNSVATATGLNSLASLYNNMGQYEKAEPLYLQAKEIRKTVLGDMHPHYAMSLNDLGDLYQRMDQYEKAELLNLQAKEIFKTVMGDRHPDYASSLSTLAGLYQAMGKYEKAEPLYVLNSQIVLENIKHNFTILSEKEKGDYLDNNVTVIVENNSFLYNYRKTSPLLIINNFNLQLFFKSLLLAETRNMLETVDQSRDSSVRQLFRSWQINKTILSKEYSRPIGQRRQDLGEIAVKADTQEKELTRRSSEFRSQKVSLQISMQDVQRNLQQDEAAIEFVRFRLYNKKWTDSTIYAAYVLRKNDTVPIYVPLCEEKQLQQLFDSAGSTATTMVKRFYRGVELTRNSTHASLGNVLFKLIWQPLEPYLNGIKNINYSPAGKIFNIALSALPIDSTKLLMDKYHFQQYTSTRQIALREAGQTFTKPNNITLFGNASFTMDNSQIVNQAIKQPSAEPISHSIYTPHLRGTAISTWDDLPGTAEEVKRIRDLFSQNKTPSTSFLETTATEENLKALNGHSPQILHIATHGFFLPEPDKKNDKISFDQGNSYTFADDPLLRSGLMFAGCNYAWSGKTPVDGMEDGIATAYEISQLNLRNTELVVLSACETALGDVKGSEGVFGLQRSFKMAGVQKMIVSLWQVPDKETAELMVTFYTYWLNGKSINNAFNAAQAEMRKKYPPFYWAAFVLVE